jgi:GntR family transcriptional regulator
MSTLYSQIGQRILDQIRSGALKVGDRLPPEAEYAAELGISRSTLRLAFSDLEASGVLKRRKRAGTEIISDTPRQRFSMATTGINELLSLGRDTEFKITATSTVPTADIPQLDGYHSETGHWLAIQGERRLNGEPTPFCVNRVYVPARYAGIEPVLKTSVFRAIEENFDVSVGRVSQAATAIACPTDEANIMGLISGAPVLQITAQLFTQNDDLMEISIATFDPQRFQVRTDVQIE